MTTNSDDQLGAEAQQRLTQLFPAVLAWRTRTESPPLRPAIGSSLSKDDEIADPYEISHAVIGAIVSAVDHLDAIRALVQDAHILHARTPFTLLRAALENSAIAVWLLAPANRNERLLRRLRLQWDDSRDGEKASKLIGTDPSLTRDEWQHKLQAVARSRGLPEEQVTAVTKKATFTEIVQTAGNETQGLSGRDAMLGWTMASGIAHARPWAVLSPALNQVKVPGAPVGHVGLRLSASDKVLVFMCGVTAKMVAEGWRLFDERRQSF